LFEITSLEFANVLGSSASTTSPAVKFIKRNFLGLTLRELRDYFIKAKLPIGMQSIKSDIDKYLPNE
jgi:hypothetical protein